MAYTDHVNEAIRYLEASRQELTDELNRVTMALQALQGTRSVNTTVVDATTQRRSVKTQVLWILDSAPGPWKTAAIVAALEQQEDAPQVADLGNSVRTSLMELARSGAAFRIVPGEYRSAKWQRAEDASAPGPKPGALDLQNGSAALTAEPRMGEEVIGPHGDPHPDHHPAPLRGPTS